jgi:hypothetical protein
MSSGLDSYDNPEKNKWRRWQWEQATRLLPEFIMRPSFNPRKLNAIDRITVQNKTVAYLCGPDDLDRHVALQLGYLPENLLAIDKNAANIDSVRRNGGTGISCDLSKFLLSASGFHVDILLADFTWGITSNFFEFLISMFASDVISDDTVVVINLLRGRDSHSNFLRDLIAQYEHKIAPQFKTMRSWQALWAASIVSAYPVLVFNNQHRSNLHEWLNINSFHKACDCFETRKYAYVNCMRSSFKASGYTYKSGPQYFDSIACVWVRRCCDAEFYRPMFSAYRDEQTFRKIAALKAVRTQKLKQFA